MNVLFLAGLFPEESKASIIDNSKGVIQYAADNLQWSILKGLDANNISLHVVNLPYVGSFPFRYKKIILPSHSFSINSKMVGTNIGFINLLGFKYLSRYYQAEKALDKEVKNTDQEVHIMVYAMHTPFLKAAVKVKKKYKHVKVILIVPDLPEFMEEKSSGLLGFLKQQDCKELYHLTHHVDGFVILSEYMKDALAINKRPYVVVEGIYNETLIDDEQKYEKNEKIVVLYTGTLAKRYGILNLLKAFSQLSMKEFCLWVCGDGDGKDMVIEASKTNSHIQYLGQLPHLEIVKLQTKADILVNPRTSDADFTKYSFPSKTIEYLASGTPSIIHPLEGIPNEYYEYVCIANEQNENGLADKIRELAKLTPQERKMIGDKARKFIIEKKNAKFQVAKIINMMKKI